MKRKLCIGMIVACMASTAFVKAQTADELWHDNLLQYLEYVQKGKTDKTLKPMADCARHAKKAKVIDNNMKVLTWYLYLAELIKQAPQSRDIGEYSALICNYGSQLEEKPLSYGLDMITANAYLLRTAYVKPEWKPVMLVNAYSLLNRLEEEKVASVVEEDYEGFYGLAQLSVSNEERLNMMNYVLQQMESLSGKDWYDAAQNAHDHYKFDGYRQAALTCVSMSEKKEFADAWALHGYMHEIGRVVEKDKTQAAHYYKAAADKGSVWGKVEYAALLIGGKIVKQNYAQALQLLTSVEDKPDFLRYGGGYYLGRLYENGWAVETDREKAMMLYTDSFEKCIWKGTKKLSYEGSKRLENKLVEEAIDQEMAGVDTKGMSAEELTAIAQRYETVGAQRKALDYLLQAVDKGSSYSACRLGMKWFDSANKKNQVLLQGAFRLFQKGAEGNYAPCKYNVAVMYLYGYGTSPNHDMALDYYNRYMEQIAAEGYNEYEKDDYIGTITGMLYKAEATKQGVPLKKAIDEFNQPAELYQWARFRERDSRPEISIYFYTRAMQKGHPKAAERLEAFKKRLQQEPEK